MDKDYIESKENVICKICLKQFEHLGSHIWHRHKIESREYKQKFGLDYNLPLISEKVRIKKQIAFDKDREKYLKNLSGGNRFRFKKKKQKRKYFSKQSIENVTKRINESNITRKKELCPICNLKYNFLDSHLYNKHKLVRVK